MFPSDDIASLREIAVFWTALLRDEGMDLKDRLKVSELLCKVNDIPAQDNGNEEMSVCECYSEIRKIME